MYIYSFIYIAHTDIITYTQTQTQVTTINRQKRP